MIEHHNSPPDPFRLSADLIVLGPDRTSAWHRAAGPRALHSDVLNLMVEGQWCEKWEHTNMRPLFDANYEGCEGLGLGCGRRLYCVHHEEKRRQMDTEEVQDDDHDLVSQSGSRRD